jgi:hypothetical protein
MALKFTIILRPRSIRRSYTLSENRDCISGHVSGIEAFECVRKWGTDIYHELENTKLESSHFSGFAKLSFDNLIHPRAKEASCNIFLQLLMF